MVDFLLFADDDLLAFFLVVDLSTRSCAVAAADVAAAAAAVAADAADAVLAAALAQANSLVRPPAVRPPAVRPPALPKCHLSSDALFALFGQPSGKTLTTSRRAGTPERQRNERHWIGPTI